MALNFRQFWDDVQSKRDAASTATSAAAPSATPAPPVGGSNFFSKPPTHEFSSAPYSIARKAGGIMSGTGERPERSQSSKLNFQA